MQCCVCKEKPATVHLTQIVGEKMQKLDLCEDCAKAKGINDPTSFAMADLMLGLGAAQELESAGGGVEVKCPRCGFTLCGASVPRLLRQSDKLPRDEKTGARVGPDRFCARGGGVACRSRLPSQQSGRALTNSLGRQLEPRRGL